MRAVMERPGDTLLGLDFDGVLSPIINDPDHAYAHPAAVAALGRLGRHLGTIAIITGRPALAAARLGGFRTVPGLEKLIILGQYGVERWEAETDRFDGPPEPEAIADVADALPEVFAGLGLNGVRVENKGRAIGVHTRELADPAAAFNALLEPLRDLARLHGLHLEPGKQVLEIRGPGIDKGDALYSIMAETGAKQVIFGGDDLGDLPAFRAVQELRASGVPGLLVCSASDEQDALTKMSDLILDGPEGVAAWLTRLADSLDARHP